MIALRQGGQLSGIRTHIPFESERAAKRSIDPFGRRLARLYEYDVVHSGFAALELITQKRFDVVLMDIQMPGMDGLKTIKEIRTLGVRCPIITVTALKDIVELSPKQTAEIAAHAGKPTDIPDLIATIQGVIAIRDL
jgi:CheY-like chemotaxis protein